MTRNQRFNSNSGHPHSHASKKQQERAIREGHRKERQINSYLADDENFPSFAVQLKKLGLQLRDIPGDGNCLFRALGDQLEGHCRDHYRHRQETVQYMRDHRHDFEPFVEDDVPFDDHINNLRKQGTHAGNDAIVAFAKLHDVNIMIHQLNGKPLMIQGPANGTHIRQLHLAYHNGDHYSSIRRQGDNTETPANIRLQDDAKQPGPSHAYSGDEDVTFSFQGMDYIEGEVMKATGCRDVDQVRGTLGDCDYDVDAAIATLMQTMELGDGLSEADEESRCAGSGLWGPEGTGSRIFGGGGGGGVSEQVHGNNSSSSLSSGSKKGSGARPKHSGSAQQQAVTGRKTKEAKKLEKKQRAVQRHRDKMLGVDHPRQLLQQQQQQSEEEEEEETLVIRHDVTKI